MLAKMQCSVLSRLEINRSCFGGLFLVFLLIINFPLFGKSDGSDSSNYVGRIRDI